MTRAGFGIVATGDSDNTVVFPDAEVSKLLDKIESNIHKEMLEDMAKYNDRLYKDSAWMLTKAFLDIYTEHLRIEIEEKRVKKEK